MLKAEIKTKIIITNEEIAEFLFKDGSLIDEINQILDDMLFDKYKMDYEARDNAIDGLTAIDYAEILRIFASKVLKEG